MRVVFGTIGAIAGGVVGIFAARVTVGADLANASPTTLLLLTAVFVALVVGGAWGGSKMAK